MHIPENDIDLYSTVWKQNSQVRLLTDDSIHINTQDPTVSRIVKVILITFQSSSMLTSKMHYETPIHDVL